MGKTVDYKALDKAQEQGYDALTAEIKRQGIESPERTPEGDAFSEQFAKDFVENLNRNISKV